MKFKTIEVADTHKRQITMEVSSPKELVLYAEQFKTSDNTNHEFVIGLPLAVRDYSNHQLDSLSKQITEQFKTVCKQQFAIAIHSKKEVDEVHFHISYVGELMDPDTVYNLYS